ncbi:hypothetical protein [Undibacterium sp. Ren11W]|uniref:hypothetical protein n=1 Tax=Undibacterium sp. Ren11W TaxID=3413045 RepID=UPI003BF18E5F
MLKLKASLTLTALCAVLSGCYVVPIQSYSNGNNSLNSQNAAAIAVLPPLPRPVYTARLYPVNEAAAALGRITGTISNPERGHGEFSFTAGSESFVGEATREPGSSKGHANASGNRGGFVKCDYAMSSSSLGTGSCLFSGGARYDMHVSL